MPIHLTAAQYRALGIPAGAAAQPGPAPAPDRGARPAAAGRPPAPVYVCRDCAVTLVGQAATVRHLDDKKHARFELVLELEPSHPSPKDRSV
jgi:hypothetical protein